MKNFVKSIIPAVAFMLISSAAVYASDYSGTYEGWYYANQGQTGVTLTINDDNTGVFEFYNMPGQSNASNGSFNIKAEENGDVLSVEGTEWIERPSGYDFVSLDGVVEDGQYIGTVSNNSSWEFVLNKNNDNYQQVADSVFNNHKYELFTDGLSWSAAKARCEELGGHLVSITSEAEQGFVESLLAKSELDSSTDIWIGMSRDLNEFNEWVTGEAVDYSNWGYPQPDNLGGQGYAVITNGERGSEGGRYYIKQYEWDDNKDSSRPYICEWDTWSDAAEWSTPELEKAAEIGLIPDVLVGKDMTDSITRGEFAAVAVNLFEEMTSGRAVMSSDCTFEDIANDENRNYILKAYNIGAINGYSDSEFAPSSPITREQLATMLCRVYKKSEWPDWSLATDDNYTINYSGVQKFDDDADISDYAKPSVYFMVKYGVLTGIGSNIFAPKNLNSEQEAIGYANATREQAIVMSLRSYENLQ